MVTKLLGLASEFIVVEVISKKKNDLLPPNAEDDQSVVGVDLQRKVRSLRLPFMGAGPYGDSYAPLLLNLIRLTNSLLNKCKNLWPTQLTCCGPPVENQCFRSTLHFFVLHSKLLGIFKNYFLINIAFISAVYKFKDKIWCYYSVRSTTL